jgi:hypothetical protein
MMMASRVGTTSFWIFYDFHDFSITNFYVYFDSMSLFLFACLFYLFILMSSVIQ